MDGERWEEWSSRSNLRINMQPEVYLFLKRTNPVVALTFRSLFIVVHSCFAKLLSPRGVKETETIWLKICGEL